MQGFSFQFACRQKQEHEDPGQPLSLSPPLKSLRTTRISVYSPLSPNLLHFWSLCPSHSPSFWGSCQSGGRGPSPGTCYKPLCLVAELNAPERAKHSLTKDWRPSRAPLLCLTQVFSFFTPEWWTHFSKGFKKNTYIYIYESLAASCYKPWSGDTQPWCIGTTLSPTELTSQGVKSFFKIQEIPSHDSKFKS